MRTSNRFRFLAAGVACVSAVLSAGAAQAQTAATESGDEIIVTATRRSENLQDVPVSVAAVSAERIQNILAGGGDALSLAARVPGLNVESSNGRVAPRFYIRGLGNTDFDLAASQPVSVIMDDVVMENVALKSFPLFDIEQVEVLRGPQGTLFGRNTPAGIVNIRSARPSEDFTARANASYATYGTASVDGAVGGKIANGLTGRISGLYQRRDDWVDNGFTGQKDAMGGYEEFAGRIQLMFEPTPQFSALANVHARELDGTSTLFRANVFTAGSNKLNQNFDRNTVFYNQGDNNPQNYSSLGGALTLTYDFGGMKLTAISGYDTAEGSSFGDIDGGVAGTGPGFIPFDSATKDTLKDLKQFTQEIRLSSPDTGRLKWQVGAYYFDADFNVTTVGVGFPPPATVAHSNTSWAVFAQTSYDVTPKLTLTGGLRYTDDDKDFHAITAPLYATLPTASASDQNVSWDVSAKYAVNDDVNVYGRVASGFRAPSIQGRDVAFGSAAAPSIADSETVLSYEAGVKADVLNGTGRINTSVFYYTIEDQQFSAIGGAANLTQLVNADEGEAYGVEVDSNFQITERLSGGVGFSYTHTEIKDATLTVAPCGSGQCTVLDPLTPGGLAIVNGNPFPQSPEFMLDINARYERPVGQRGAVFADTDWAVRGEANIFLYDAAEFRLPTQVEGALRVGYAGNNGAYEVAVFAKNITDEENVIGAIDFNNLTGFVNEPRIIGISLSAKR